MEPEYDDLADSQTEPETVQEEVELTDADLDAYETNSQAIEAEVEDSVPEASPDQELDMDMDR